MGLLDNINPTSYYWDTSNSTLKTGGYQFVTLDNIINAFMVAYVGEDKLLSKVSRTDVQFHGMRAIQELSYDVFRSIKSHEIWIPNGLKMPLPMDYVNYIKVARVDENGIERMLYPTGKTSNPFAVEQYVYVPEGEENTTGALATTQYESMHGRYVVDHSNAMGEDLEEVGAGNSDINLLDATGASHEGISPFASQALNKWQDSSEGNGYSSDTTDLEVDNRGRRYGLDPQYAQANGTFIIDNRTGFIYFGSPLAGETIILKYVSDGLGTDEEMIVHKFCEEACYKWIMYGILSVRSNIPEYIVARYKKERFAETRKAKIRLSNIKIEEFAQVLKGMGKQIK